MGISVDSRSTAISGAVAGESKEQLQKFREFLQHSAEIRMRAIQERISTAETLCTTVEIQIRFAQSDRARGYLGKLRSTIDKLFAHIADPAHVSDELLKQDFRKQLARIEQRLSSLESQITQPLQ